MKALFVGLGCLSVVLSVNAIIEKGVDFNTLVNGTIHNSMFLLVPTFATTLYHDQLH